jgi:hypothetical protein
MVKVNVGNLVTSPLGHLRETPSFPKTGLTVASKNAAGKAIP